MTATGSALERDGDRVRLITRGGYNWAEPLSVDRRGGLEEPRHKQFVIDGEAVVLSVSGRLLGYP